MTRSPTLPPDGDSLLEWGIGSIAVAAVSILSIVSGLDPATTLAVLVGVGWLAIVFGIVVWALEGDATVDSRYSGAGSKSESRSESKSVSGSVAESGSGHELESESKSESKSKSELIASTPSSSSASGDAETDTN